MLEHVIPAFHNATNIKSRLRAPQDEQTLIKAPSSTSDIPGTRRRYLRTSNLHFSIQQKDRLTQNEMLAHRCQHT